jgi:hypothetical protein
MGGQLMAERMVQFFILMGMAGLCAINVYMGVTTGSAISWAASAFIALLAINQAFLANKR